MSNPRKQILKLTEKVFKKKEDKYRTAVDRLDGVMRFVNLFAWFSGLQFTENWKRNRRVVFAVCINLLTLSCAIYSLYVSFPSIDSFILVGTFAFNAVVWTKLIFVSLNHQRFMSLVRFVCKVFKSNTSGPQESILIGVTKTMNYHLALNFGSFLVGYAFYSAFPLYETFFNGKLTLVSPMLVPLVDSNHLRGYFITTGCNLFVLSYCVTICVAVSSLFFTLVNAYDGLVSLVEHDFGSFDVMCDKNEGSKTYDAPFRNLMMRSMDLARFSYYMNDVYKVISTGQVSMSFLVVICGLAGYIAFNFVNCSGGAMVFYTEMLMYCYIGQILDNTNKRFVTVICNAKWYCYKVKYQRDIMVALYIAQNMHPIRLANVYPLNYDTALKLTKNIYTLSMFMIEMFA